MTRGRSRILLGLTGALICLLPAAVGAGTSPQSSQAVDWSPRLARLGPARPLEYFLLAEEVADQAESDADRDLARRLFGIAAVLDPGHLGRSACLALLDLEEQPHHRRRLQALADLLGRSAGVPFIGSAMVEGDGQAANRSAAFAVAEAFGLYRRGEGQAALATLDEPGARALLESFSHLIPGGAERFLEDCRVYRSGQRQPSLVERELTAMLQLEAALLAGPQRSWSADLMLGGGAPLIEVDPEELASSLGVDAENTVWRNGAWTAPPR